ncbi:30S ribosomal protein S27e [Candidatus Micrarchaeota archaeon]|nr:30S ribosomal protein S27e [Candidatus Micrarchaeota archaeon]
MEKFIKVKCSACGEEKTVFYAASRKVVCSCGQILSAPTGGRAAIIGEKTE